MSGVGSLFSSAFPVVRGFLVPVTWWSSSVLRAVRGVSGGVSVAFRGVSGGVVAVRRRRRMVARGTDNSAELSTWDPVVHKLIFRGWSAALAA